MGDPSGFLKVERLTAPKRPVLERLRDQRTVYQPLPLQEQRRQASRCMDCGVPFCTTGCPLGNLIPDWNDLVYRDRWREAIDRLHATNNFPEFTGFLCPAPCEASCVLSINDDAVTIKEIELSIVQHAFDHDWIQPDPPQRRTGKRVAVVGSGPAGLAAAQQLNRVGHQVTVFEKEDKLGGLLRYGIPDFKLEKWVVDRRLDILEQEGIRFITGAHVGVNPTVDEIHAEFDSVLLAVGALQERDLPLAGRDLQGIYPAMSYLVQRNRLIAGEWVDPNTLICARDRRVVIIGGGDTSADCLGASLREGAASVQVLTHGPQPPNAANPLVWPDWPFILRTYPAHEEGGERRWNLAITGFSGSNGKVERVRVADARRTSDGGTEPVPGTDWEIEADLVLLSIGYTGPVQDRLLPDIGAELDPSGAISAVEGYRTSADGVYVAGDAKRGASLIVWAIAEGRQAAREIDIELMGTSLLPA